MSLIEIKALIDVMEDLMSWVNKVPVSGLSIVEIVEAGVKESVTFYDAAFVVAAKLKGLLRRICMKPFYFENSLGAWGK